jgi:23S rRNA pseudouridine955/2504/2580 synthase
LFVDSIDAGSDLRGLIAKLHLGQFSRRGSASCITIGLFLGGTPTDTLFEGRPAGPKDSSERYTLAGPCLHCHFNNHNTLSNVAKPIIGAKTPTRRLKTPEKAVHEAVSLPSVAAVQHLIVDEGSEGQRLDNFLIKSLKGAPKTLVYRIIRSGEVRVNKGRAQADTRLNLGDDVRVPPLRLSEAAPDAAPAPAREFPILFEDDFFLAINKPAGVAVHGGSGVSFGVIEQLRRARPTAKFLELVHRLDKETSGILLVAKKRSALVTLQDAFRQRTAHKTYAAMALGQWPESRKVIDVSLHKFLTAEGERRVMAVSDDAGGQRAITLVKIIKVFHKFTLLDVTIKTGRTHQIRVHLASEGHPILGDEKYGDFALNKAMARGAVVQGVKFDRMFLHARLLRIPHPATGAEVTLEAPLPSECQALVDDLK